MEKGKNWDERSNSKQRTKGQIWDKNTGGQKRLYGLKSIKSQKNNRDRLETKETTKTWTKRQKDLEQKTRGICFLKLINVKARINARFIAHIRIWYLDSYPINMRQFSSIIAIIYWSAAPLLNMFFLFATETVVTAQRSNCKQTANECELSVQYMYYDSTKHVFIM